MEAMPTAMLVRKLGFRVNKVAFNLNVFAPFSIAHNNAKRKGIFSPQVILGRVAFNFPRCCFAAGIAALCLSSYYDNVFKLFAGIVLD